MSDKFRQERKAAIEPTERDMAMPEPPQLSDIDPNFEQEIVAPNSQPARMQQKRNQELKNDPRERFSQFKDQAYEAVLKKLQPISGNYDEITMPSLGKFYSNGNGPSNGILHIRPMTGAEEQILATPRYVKKNAAINKIFSQCISESFDPDNLLTIDRTYLLIYLRGISFTPAYDVDVQCPSCSARFQTTIDLNNLNVEDCPEDFSEAQLKGVMPTSKLSFNYRLSTGKDERAVTEHRERRLKEFGDAAADDTLIYRASLLIEEIEGVSDQMAIQQIIARLPINDVAYLRNLINEPPFGVDTKIEMICPSCTCEFEVDLPLESNFFFPRRNREEKKMASSH